MEFNGFYASSLRVNVAKEIRYTAAAYDAGLIFFFFLRTCCHRILCVYAFLVGRDVGFFYLSENVDVVDFVGFESLKQAAKYIFSRI